MRFRFIYYSLFILVFVTYSNFIFCQIITESSKSLPEPYPNNEFDGFGESVYMSGSYTVVGSPSQGENIAYVSIFELQPDGTWKSIARLTPSDGNLDNSFGCSVSMFNETIVVGAKGDEKHGSRMGRVFVFEKPTGGWQDMNESAVLRSSNNEEFDYFGCSVSIYENTIVVGKYHNYAYVFEKPESGWENSYETAILSPRAGSSNEYFGSCVSVHKNTVVVGAKYDNAKGDKSGSVYVFEKPEGGWINMPPTAKLNASDEDEFDEFGFSASIWEEVIAVGSPRSYGNYRYSGSVYIFHKEETNWSDKTESIKIFESGGYMWDEFGKSTFLSNEKLIIGAPGVRKDGITSGAVFSCDIPLTPSSYAEGDLIKMQPSDLKYETEFGCSVSTSNGYFVAGSSKDHSHGFLSGTAFILEQKEFEIIYSQIFPDFDLKNFRHSYGASVAMDGLYAVVGASGYEGGKGAAFVYFVDDGEWVKLAKLTASDAEFQDYFGTSVDIYQNTIVVGATLAKNGTEYQYGSAYVYVMPADGWKDMTETAKLIAKNQKSAQRFGFDVAISSDLVVVGAYEHDSGTENDGAAYLYQKPAQGWSDMTETVLLTPGFTSLDCWYYGHSVDVEKNTVIIGANRNKNGYSGCVYVYEKLADTDWIDVEQKAMLRPVNGYSGTDFGFDVSISNENILVGAVDDYGSGSAYIFNKPEAGWNNENKSVRLYSTDNTTGGDFGHSVYLSPDNIAVIAAPFNSTGAEGTGAIYLFEQTDGQWIESTEKYKYLASDRKRYDIMGFGGVVYSDGYIIAGASHDDGNAISSGSAYLFEKADLTVHSSELNESIIEEKSYIKLYVISSNAEHVFSFSLDSDLVDNRFFEVQNDTIMPVAGFDYEKKSTYSILIKATEISGMTIVNDFEIHIKDIPPIIQDTAFVFDENQTNKLLIDNLYNRGDTSSIIYNIVSGYDENIFYLSENGQIFLQKQEAFDYEKNDEFSIRIAATDGKNDSEGLIKIIINDIPPILSDTLVVFDENQINGLLLENKYANGDTSSIEFSIAAGNEENTFFLDDKGQIYLQKQEEFDFEENSEFKIRIAATDGKSDSEGLIKIIINDIPPILSDTIVVFDENQINGLLLENKYANGDTSSIEFSIVAGNEENTFFLDDKGQIYLQKQEEFDFEKNGEFHIRIAATDGKNDSVATISIKLNDLTPIAINSIFEIDENIYYGEIIGQIFFEGDTSSVFSTILSGNMPIEAFSINNANELILENNDFLDYEVQPSFSLYVLVSDGVNDSIGTVNINLKDIAPILNDTTFIVKSIVEDDYFIGKLNSEGDINSIFYEINSGNDLEIFSINSETGELFVGDAKKLRSAGIFEYPLIVKVYDKNNINTGDISISIDFITDLEDVIAKELRIYPNPAHSELLIGNISDSFSYSIINSSGKSLVEGEQLSKIININNLADGVYILKLITDDAMYIKHFIKK